MITVCDVVALNMMANVIGNPLAPAALTDDQLDTVMARGLG
jgi:hypothetical protein